MKTLMIMLTLASTGTAMAQKMNAKEVPAEVKNSLQKNFGITRAEWDKEENGYEANFTSKGKEMSVAFDGAGKILETETEIGQHELPASVLAVLKNEYAGFKVEEAAKIMANGVQTYEAEIEKEEQSFELIFDEQGNVLKKEAEKKEKDKD